MNIKKCIIGRVQGSYIPAKCYAKVKMMTVSDSKRDEIVKLIGQYIDSYQIQNADDNNGIIEDVFFPCYIIK